MKSNFDRANEIRNTVREEVSRILGTGDRRTETVSDAGNSTSTPPLTFEEFYQSRERQRQQGFQPRKKKKKGNPPPSKANPPPKAKNVEVKVGLAAQSDGVFKQRRGKTHVVALSSGASKEELVATAISKHSSFDQSFDDSILYTLLYPDFREVFYIPGTTEKFSLSAYKDAIGKEYKRLTFYLIPEEDVCEIEDDSGEEREAKNTKIEISDEESERDLLLNPWWEQPAVHGACSGANGNNELQFCNVSEKLRKFILKLILVGIERKGGFRISRRKKPNVLTRWTCSIRDKSRV